MGFERLFRSLFGRDRQGQRVDGTEATVYINEVAHAVVDWSESGLRIANYDGSPPVGERFAFRFELPLTSDDMFEFEAWAEVIESDPRGLAARYLFIEDHLTERLRSVVRVLGTTDIAAPRGAVDYN